MPSAKLTERIRLVIHLLEDQLTSFVEQHADATDFKTKVHYVYLPDSVIQTRNLSNLISRQAFFINRGLMDIVAHRQHHEPIPNHPGEFIIHYTFHLWTTYEPDQRRMKLTIMNEA